MGACSRLTLQSPTVFAAEALAVVHGLKFALNLSSQSVILKSDSSSVIQKLNASLEDILKISALIWEVKELSKLFSDCRFTFIVRPGNQVTHAMAQGGMSRTEDCFRVEKAPLLTTSAADEDRRLLVPP